MKNADNKRVQQFLDDIKEIDFEKYSIIEKCRKIVFALTPYISERIIYGGIMFSKKGMDFGGVFASKNHVSFEFTNGFELKDNQELLEGKGKYRRHLKLKSIDDVNKKQVEFFVGQSLNKLTL